MTQWSTSGVVQFCAKAGWNGADLVNAAAVALAASGGADHYDYDPLTTGDERRSGLFAMRATDVVGRVALDLFNPIVSAAAAYARWRTEGRHWLWHPAWESGEAGNQTDLVRATIDRPNPLSGAAAPGTFQRAVSEAMHRATSLRLASQRIRNPYA